MHGFQTVFLAHCLQAAGAKAGANDKRRPGEGFDFECLDREILQVVRAEAREYNQI